MSTNNPHIAPLLDILDDTLCEAARAAHEAALAMRGGNQNLALGTLLPLGDQLSTARALYETAQSLHRRGPS